MPKEIRMIAFDLDDTALDAEKTLRPTVIAAIEEAARRGVVMLPATGRMRSGIPAELLAIPGIRYAITSNGAKIYDLAGNHILFSNCFDEETALSVLNETETERSFVSIFIGGVSYTTSQDISYLRDVLTPAALQYLKTSRIYTPDIVKLIKEGDEPVEKFTVYYPSLGETEDARRRLEARGDLAITSSMGPNLELNTKTASKGAALMTLAEMLNIPRSGVMAVGDSTNDVDMLQRAGYGVAMGNAGEEVQKAADAVGPPSTEGGLADIIKGVL